MSINISITVIYFLQLQPVDEDHDVGPPIVLALDHRELVHGQTFSG